MKIAVYPGSFNPLHEGHMSVIKQIEPLFDKIIVAIGRNAEKSTQHNVELLRHYINAKSNYNTNPINIEINVFDGLLKDAVKRYKGSAIIRGLRNAQDFEYEKIQQYCNEDLGIAIPTLYVISDRNLTHISSSAIKALKKAKQ